MQSDLDAIRETLARIPDPVALLEGFFAHAPVALQIYEASGRSVLTNAAFRELFGSEPPPEYNVLKDEIAERTGILGLIHRAFAGETSTTPPTWYDPRELRQVQVEGRRVAIIATFFPIFGPDRRVTHVGVSFRDVTAETLAREALERERELLSAVIEQIAEGVVVVDVAGVLWLANAAARGLGIVETNVEMARWEQVYRLELPDGTPVPLKERPLYRALQGEANVSLVHLRSPGGRRVVRVSAAPIRSRDGVLRGAVASLHDETERLAREAEQERAAMFRERFIGIVGHDLRSPLTAIAANAGLVLRHHGLPDAVSAAAARTASTAMRMGRMISDLLDFTQARLGGGLTIQRRPIDLAEVAQAAIDEATATHPGRTATLETAGDTSGSFDPDRVAQLLSNLLQNAFVYSPPAAEVSVRVNGERDVVEICVANHGPRIPSDELATLFDPFRRGRSAGESRGLGLGLYIVQQIALAHGGGVSVTSDDHETAFRARLQR